ncbi:MAG: FtsQ-type POTRA domain-containing protein [Candidatus Thiodiazotropha sp. (ex Monitilora ramsayi)]|nr:FtsQ-type POTRA domain-containing protein [Candidatus Thiodiazotropha sp. (ex Monitilora ramsayi)]
MSRSQKTQPTPVTISVLRSLAMPLLSVLLIAGLLSWGVLQARDPQVMPVRVVGVDGEIQHLERSRLEAAVAEAVDGSFFSVNLDQVRQKIERLPWIESASIRRVWPDTLRVNVVEQVPLAYWGKDGLVSQRGEVFRPKQVPKLAGLSVLEGDDQSASRITREYLRMRTLLETAGLNLQHVWVDARQAWRLKTESGLMLHLGRREVMPRLTRFVQLYPYLQQQTGSLPEAVDLRYTNGFTVRWQVAEAQVNLNSRTPERAATRIAGI